MRKYPDRPWVGIGIVVHKDDQVLLIKRGKEPNLGLWSLPGGAQTLGETVKEAAFREVLEETNVHTINHQLIDVVDSIHKDTSDKITYHYTLIEISCEYDNGNIIAQDDAADAQWVHVSDINNFGLQDETLRIIDMSYRSRKASLTDE